MQCTRDNFVTHSFLSGKGMVVYGKGIVWFTFMTVEYKLRCFCSASRVATPLWFSPNYTSVFFVCVCVCVCVSLFISSVGFELVCLWLYFKELKSSHSCSVHFVYNKLPHKVSKLLRATKRDIWKRKKREHLWVCVVLYDLCVRACACVCLYICVPKSLSWSVYYSHVQFLK